MAESRPLGFSAEPVRDISGVVVKPLSGQLSNEMGATDESGVPVPEEIGVKRVTGRNVGALESTLENACLPSGVNLLGEDAAELNEL